MVEPLERPLSSYIHTQFVTADENSSVAEAVKILQPKNVEVILVTSSNGKYVGIVTDSDILEKVVMKGEDSDLVFLKSIMTSPIITLPSSSTVRQAIKVMRAHKIKHLPVTDSTNNNDEGDRKSTRLNSSHSQISYAVFCLKKKKKKTKKKKKNK